MAKLSDIFNIYTARSKGFERYSRGQTAFVSNGFYNNGVVGYVETFGKDRVFDKIGICVSGFCEATVQKPPFLARGNGGSGLVVLIPKKQMDYQTLLSYSSIINNCLKWRYSYGRMANRTRLLKESLPIGDFKYNPKEFLPERVYPKFEQKSKMNFNFHFKKVPILALFDLIHGDFHSLDALDSGCYPTISRTDFNNGIVGFYAKPLGAVLYRPPLITVSTVSGQAFVQLEEFISTDNVVICLPKRQYKVTTLFFICMMLNSEKWRWMYGRQCYKTKFSKTILYLPHNNKTLDELVIEKFVNNQSSWKLINGQLTNNGPNT
ncbi:MAG: hypothetical protein ACUZ8I_13325 [Candidatus Scalindua sp.]